MGPSPIIGTTFGTCEENCVMENPVQVTGMNATLYDVTCRGDWGTKFDRMLFARISSPNGGIQTVVLTYPSGVPALTAG
jgi:hypothetical protein